MSKHPGPWYLDCSDGISYVFDAYGRSVCATTADPETRVLLLHAQEMFTAIRDVATTRPNSSGGIVATREACRLHDKIEAEIAAKRKP